MNSQKTKVIFFLPSLSAGGAERVMSYIAQHINNQKYNVTLAVVGFEKDNAFEVHNIDVIYLNKPRVLTSLVDCIFLIKRLKPKIVISVLNLNTYMGFISILFPKCKFIGRIVNIGSVLKHHPEKSNRYFPSFLNKYGDKRLDYIICQSQDMYNDVLKHSGFKKSKLVVINNPITKSFDVKKNVSHQSPNRTYKFITVGSLERRKGHLRLLNVLSKLKNVNFQYTIIGKGSQKDTIFSKIKELNLEDKITHIPYTDKVAKFLSESDFFLQGSFVEGFPNALIETCAVGTPAIAFEAPGGINEIIQDNVNGFIANSEEDFKNKIDKALSKAWDPQIVHDSVFKKYNSNTILEKYESLFDSCITK
ncbi:glycosyltransferase [Algibacter sp. 2305UL17-15]|uniref:glycosyltransferase n=1 Tax=Algibacter sp. 2305UL17-15 TaxID=3231268 RepID=UPI00345B1AF3